MVVSRLPVPSAGAIAASDRLLADIYKEDLTKTSQKDQEALAHKMMDEIAQMKDQPAAEYVLLQHARDHAAKAGNAELALAAARRMSDRFAVDGRPLIAEALTTASTAALAMDSIRKAMAIDLDVAEMYLSDGDYSSAAQFAALAQSCARRGVDPTTAQPVLSITPLILAAGDAHRLVAPSFQALKVNPADAAANLAVGRFYCFNLGQWTTGLPLLAKGSDPVLKDLASREIAAPQDAAAQSALADGWLAAAKLSPDSKDAMERRAAYWYGQAVQGLNGLTRLTAEKHIAELRAAHLQRGLTCELFNGRDFERRLLTRIDTELNHNWRGEIAAVGVPKEYFGGRWAGWLKPAVAGSYKFTLSHDDGARMWLDGKQVLNSWDMGSRNSLATIDLTAEPHELKVEYFQFEGDSHLGLAWVAPGAKKMIAIPAGFLFHEPLTLEQQLPSRMLIEPQGVIHLGAMYADVHGPFVHYQDARHIPAIVGLRDSTDLATWTCDIPAGVYHVDVSYSCDHDNAGGTFAISIGAARFTGVTERTSGWDDFTTASMGDVRMPGGDAVVSLFGVKITKLALLHLSEITLTPVKQ
jgi:hypothetical protein